MWILVWLQLTSGMPLAYFQISYYGNKIECEQVKQSASVMVTDTSMILACLNIGIKQ